MVLFTMSEYVKQKNLSFVREVRKRLRRQKAFGKLTISQVFIGERKNSKKAENVLMMPG